MTDSITQQAYCEQCKKIVKTNVYSYNTTNGEDDHNEHWEITCSVCDDLIDTGLLN